MLRGDAIGLRSRIESDVAILHAGFHDDIDLHARAEGRPWRPWPPTSAEGPFAVKDPVEGRAVLTIVALADDRVLGDCALWEIDAHNRSAHIGIGLLPEARGRGAGLEAVQLLCHYGFTVLGLHRLQIETNADNAAMLATARRAGFRDEGVLRGASWVMGRFLDEAVLGLLADEWVPPSGLGPAT